MTSIFMGLIFIVLGALGIFRWMDAFIEFLKGMLPFSLFVGGVITVIAGVGSLQTRRSDDSKKE